MTVFPELRSSPRIASSNKAFPTCASTAHAITLAHRHLSYQDILLTRREWIVHQYNFGRDIRDTRPRAPWHPQHSIYSLCKVSFWSQYHILIYIPIHMFTVLRLPSPSPSLLQLSHSSPTRRQHTTSMSPLSSHLSVSSRSVGVASTCFYNPITNI